MLWMESGAGAVDRSVSPALPRAHLAASLISAAIGVRISSGCFGDSTFASLGCQDTAAEGTKRFQQAAL